MFVKVVTNARQKTLFSRFCTLVEDYQVTKKRTPKKWSDIDSQRNVVEFAASKLNVKTLDDWYNIKQVVYFVEED